VPDDDARQAAKFHDATKYYSVSDAEPGDERIGIGDPADRKSTRLNSSHQI